MYRTIKPNLGFYAAKRKQGHARDRIWLAVMEAFEVGWPNGYRNSNKSLG